MRRVYRIAIVSFGMMVGVLAAGQSHAQVSVEEAMRRMQAKEAARKQATEPAPVAASRPSSQSVPTAGDADATRNEAPPAAQQARPAFTSSLTEARQGFKTRFRPNAKDLNGEHAAPTQPPAGSKYKLLKLPGPAGQLWAYLAAPPRDNRRHPAVVWLHGGFGGIDSYIFTDNPADNDQSPRQFLDGGFAVLAPSRRGENDNPGRGEYFYGEVDDTVAAIDFMARQPGVDPSRIYLVGHSTGGTLALLTAEATDKLRAAVSLGGCPDVHVYLAGSDRDELPFDPGNEQEIDVRSAAQFLRGLKTPTWYVEGSNSAYAPGAMAMARDARRGGWPFQACLLEGEPATHFTIVRPVTKLFAAKFKQDTGPTCGVSVTPAELVGAFDDEFHPAAHAVHGLVACVGKLNSVQVSLVARMRLNEVCAESHVDPRRARFLLKAANGSAVVKMTDEADHPGTAVDAGLLEVLVEDDAVPLLPADVLIDVERGADRVLRFVAKPAPAAAATQPAGR